ncbi:hypothetical protein [Caballeronia sp. INDeC2]|uniref:hypothetical protein n=1 Tax=Caballeronia sp. INDeC2 TaxID=2921747 RepID=UPI002029185B|nr:hypothetical protein [Caballeronia sp. INDeC2]
MHTKILQCGYMSGDTYAASALLAADPGVRIILLIDKSATGQYADRSTQIKRIYEDTGVMGQVIEIDISGRARIEAVWQGVKAKKYGSTARTNVLHDERTNTVLQELEDVLPRDRLPESISYVTGALANCWCDETSSAIARAWGATKLPDEQQKLVRAFMSRTFNLAAPPANIVALWSRQSGKRGGAHPELDSSFTGIRQLAEEFTQRAPRATVLLCGDERNDKMKTIASEMPQVFSMADLWKDPDWVKGFGDQTFLAQLAFFQFLRESSNVIHIGMRSGMLEPMALLGMQVFYLEDAGSSSGKRMLAFVKHGITYERVEIQCPPGLVGYVAWRDRRFLLSQAERRLEQEANRVQRNAQFQRSIRTLGWSRDEANRAARRLAKAQIGSHDAEQYRDYSPDLLRGLKNELANLRGFTSGDVQKISRHVINAFAQN